MGLSLDTTTRIQALIAYPYCVLVYFRPRQGHYAWRGRRRSSTAELGLVERRTVFLEVHGEAGFNRVACMALIAKPTSLPRSAFADEKISWINLNVLITIQSHPDDNLSTAGTECWCSHFFPPCEKLPCPEAIAEIADLATRVKVGQSRVRTWEHASRPRFLQPVDSDGLSLDATTRIQSLRADRKRCTRNSVGPAPTTGRPERARSFLKVDLLKGEPLFLLKSTVKQGSLS